MVSVLRFAIAISVTIGATVVFEPSGIAEAKEKQARGLKLQAEHLQPHATDVSDRRRRWRNYRRASRPEAPRDRPRPPLPESRCDARDMVQVDWEFIERVVTPIGDQRQHLTELKTAVAEADAKILASCDIEARLTPTGRLEAMEKRLEMRLQALKALRAPLEAFYSALDDEQKARFVSAAPRPEITRPAGSPAGQTSETDEDATSRRSRRR